MTHTAYLLLGSNQGDRLSLIQAALKAIDSHEAISISAQSSLYETAAWGKENLPPHINIAVAVNTSLAPIELLDAVQAIEQELGRERIEKWGVRTMDIDIIYYDNVVMETSRLTIPHPWLQERRFVLVPLNEIAPTMQHPKLLETNATLLAQCKDTLAVNLYII